jgi:hypothetical protein
VVARDVDADGDPDVVTVGQNDIRVFLNDGAGGVTPGPIKVDFSAGFPFIGAHPASLNGDAWPDLIIRQGCAERPPQRHLLRAAWGWLGVPGAHGRCPPFARWATSTATVTST